MVVYSTVNSDVTLLKSRKILQPVYPKLAFGDCGIIIKTSIRFEFNYLFYMRKFIKKVLKKRKGFTKSKKVWIFIRPNHVLSKKTKNSRMGKGKGKPMRWCSILPKGFVLMHIQGVPPIRLQKYVNRLQSRFKFLMQVSPTKFNTTKQEYVKLLGCKNTTQVIPS